MILKTIAGITNIPNTDSPLRGYERWNGLCALRLPAVARGYTQDRASCATAIKNGARQARCYAKPRASA